MSEAVTLTAVCGPAMMGKTTVAKFLGNELGIHVVDVDDVRAICFGKPLVLGTEDETHELHLLQLSSAYAVMYRGIEEQIRTVGRSIIMTAGISSYAKGQVSLMEVARRTRVRLKVIRLLADPVNMSDEEVALRISRRLEVDPTYSGGLGTTHGVEAFRRWHASFEPIRIPGALSLVTWPHFSIEETCRTALAYLRDPKSGYDFGDLDVPPHP